MTGIAAARRFERVFHFVRLANNVKRFEGCMDSFVMKGIRFLMWGEHDACYTNGLVLSPVGQE
jgi:hypothetical protein